MLQAATNHPCVCVQVDTLLVETPCALEVEVVPASSRALAKGGQDLLQLRKEAGSTHREVCEPQKNDPCSRYLEIIKYVYVYSRFFLFITGAHADCASLRRQVESIN